MGCGVLGVAFVIVVWCCFAVACVTILVLWFLFCFSDLGFCNFVLDLGALRIIPGSLVIWFGLFSCRFGGFGFMFVLILLFGLRV